jgi:hypothetical protein
MSPSELLHWVLLRAKRVAISQHRTSVLFTSHPKDGLVVNLYIPHNRRTPDVLMSDKERIGLCGINTSSVGKWFAWVLQVWWFVGSNTDRTKDY